MPVLQEIAQKCGADILTRLHGIADEEIAVAEATPLNDEVGREQYHQRRDPTGLLLRELEKFEGAGFRYTPNDVLDVLFDCKLLSRCGSENEFNQRRGGWPMFATYADRPHWKNKATPLPQLIDHYVERLTQNIEERTLVTTIRSYKTMDAHDQPTAFFDRLFKDLAFPFSAYIPNDALIELHKKRESLPKYDLAAATAFFSAPSIGFTTKGTRSYCSLTSSIWLQTFLNLFRIAAFLNPGQRDFGFGAEMTAPKYPVFVGDHSGGAYSWREDTKESWAKLPDGSLFRSFGYRGLSFTWLDIRTFDGIRSFVLENRRVLDNLRNPWNPKHIVDAAPILDLLSSATQIPDIGTKILLVYCCLEHMFVPPNTSTENKKYILGGLNALAPQLVPWFDSFHTLRCEYAHRGFVLGGIQTIEIISRSMRNVMRLLVAKLSVP